MKLHSCSEVRGVVVIVFTHSDCDYGPSKVMPSMEPMGQFDRRPLLGHSFTLEIHGWNCLIVTQSITRMLLCWPLDNAQRQNVS